MARPKESWLAALRAKRPGWRGTYDTCLPDMSKPENYMRALNNLPIEVTWCMYRDVEGDHETRIDRFKPTVIIARTPLEALAALYDAQRL
jgi:hypothetical protein